MAVEDLAELIDENVEDVRRILRVGTAKIRRQKNHNYSLFLRAHGMIGREYRNRTHWCLLGVGPVQMTLRQSSHLSYVMSAEPKGPYL